MNNTIEVNGHNYRVGKLNALTQFHITRRLGPILAAMGISLTQLKKATKMEMADFLPALGPITEIMAKMSNEDVNYILFTCLAVVGREQGESRFAPIVRGEAMMFEDINMPTMIRLVVEVLKDNLGDFLPGLSDEVTSQSS